ncbi:MAG: hypothetical protein HDT21_03665 [Ruminococcus sp.]|nr:hypothetical protein [Ruminococcus sp.]
MKTNQPKSVQKSIRISEDVAKYIEKQDGNGFNEKLCNMVLYCMEHEADINKKVASAEKRLEFVDKQISEKHKLLEQLESISRFVSSCLRVIQ